MNQPSKVGSWEAGGSLSHPPSGARRVGDKGRVAERGDCSAVGRIQVRPQQGLSGDSGCLPTIVGLILLSVL